MAGVSGRHGPTMAACLPGTEAVHSGTCCHLGHQLTLSNMQEKFLVASDLALELIADISCAVLLSPQARFSSKPLRGLRKWTTSLPGHAFQVSCQRAALLGLGQACLQPVCKSGAFQCSQVMGVMCADLQSCSACRWATSHWLPGSVSLRGGAHSFWLWVLDPAWSATH